MAQASDMGLIKENWLQCIIEWLNFEYLDYDIKSRAGLVFVFEYLGYWSYEDGGPKILKSA